MLERKVDRSFLEKAQQGMREWQDLMDERGTRTDTPLNVALTRKEPATWPAVSSGAVATPGALLLTLALPVKLADAPLLPADTVKSTPALTGFPYLSVTSTSRGE